MKILVLPSWYPSLKQTYGTFFHEQAQFLNQNGYEIKVLMAEELHTKCFLFHKLKRVFQRNGNSLSTNFLMQDPDAFSFPVIIQKSWTDRKKLKVMDKAYINAFKILTEQLNWFPDIIHLQGMYKYGLSSYHIAKKHRIPLVVIEHSPFKLSNYSKVHLERIKRIFQIAIKVAGVSFFHKSCLSVLDTLREVEVVWNLMDEQKFFFDNYSKSDGVFIITTVLRASLVKDPVTFFDAIEKFIQICAQNQPVEVHVVGMASLEDLTKMKGIDIYSISKYRKLHHLFKFHAWLNRDQIKELYQKSSVFVSTSVDEPHGVAIREAMLCGVPVITTKGGGPQDSVNLNTGILVELGDSIAISRAIKNIYNGEIKFDYLYIRRQIITQCGCETFLKRMQDFYQI